MEKENQKEENKNFHIKDLVKKINLFLGREKPADILIIKAHLLCEYYINQISILREICSAKELESKTFYKKIQESFDLNKPNEKRIFDYVNQLNRLRNKVGHELEYTLSESDIDSLGYLQGKDYILSKYEVETNAERLREILTTIVGETAILLINNVESEKIKNQNQNKSLPVNSTNGK